MRVCGACFERLSELEVIAEHNFLQTHRTIQNSYKLVFFGPSGAGVFVISIPRKEITCVQAKRLLFKIAFVDIVPPNASCTA